MPVNYYVDYGLVFGMIDELLEYLDTESWVFMRIVAKWALEFSVEAFTCDDGTVEGCMQLVEVFAG